ncbi:MAG: hypothetical protein ACPGJV_04685 [Bacteriovoracaceae bacterium]
MIELFAFYSFSFVVAAFSAGTLAQIGKHYYSRGNILEIFLLSQLALLGNLLSKLLFHDHGVDWMGVVLSYLFFGLGKYLLYQKKSNGHEQGVFMVGGYLFLLSLQYLLIGFFPLLDSHMSVGFFGNMVTASLFENVLIFGTSFFFLMAYFNKRKTINRNTLEVNILGSKDDSKFELFLFSIPLVTFLYSLGFLYTMSFLLLPSLFVGSLFSSEKRASVFMVFTSAICSVSGLALSIYFERLSTTSVQISLLVLFLFLFAMVLKSADEL